MDNVIKGDFPFDEIKTEDGDYFDSVEDAQRQTGCAVNQVWVVLEGEDFEKDGFRWGCCTYAPSHHYVNRLGYIVTKETHDGNTYYEESYEMGEVEDDDD